MATALERSFLASFQGVVAGPASLFWAIGAIIEGFMVVNFASVKTPCCTFRASRKNGVYAGFGAKERVFGGNLVTRLRRGYGGRARGGGWGRENESASALRRVSSLP
jgi:hypothetical protein